MNKTLLTIENLSVALPLGSDRTLAVDSVSLELRANEILCLIGESGSGKSMIANAVLRLLPESIFATEGRIMLENRDLLQLSETEMQKIRGARIGMIFQEPMTALNPLKRIGDQIAEMFLTHMDISRREIRGKVLALLADVHIPKPAEAYQAYPHELSGGQRQRAMIAMALALEPDVLIADEPTTALDVTTQAQILKLIRELQQRQGTAVLFVTHDFGVVSEIADRIAVMQHGRLVEEGKAKDVLDYPQHRYTRSLIAAVPVLKPRKQIQPEAAPILRIESISKTYKTGSLLSRNRRTTRAVNNVRISLPRGGTLGIVGESGSGKSTLARLIMRLIEPETGEVLLDGNDILKLTRRQMRAAAGDIQMVFQDPFASLNPRKKVGDIVSQGLVLHGADRKSALKRAGELLELVGLDRSAMDRYPHEFSGGQRQRIGLARALALNPKILVADEPVSALDVSVQAQVLKLLGQLREQLGLSMIFITHDLRVASRLCDRIVVMKDGEVVEEGPAERIFSAPEHPYTRALIAAIPGQHWTPGVELLPLRKPEKPGRSFHDPA